MRDQRRKILLDIQAEIKRQLPKISNELSHITHLDIQDEITTKIIEITLLLKIIPSLDIQDQMDITSCIYENEINNTGGENHGRKESYQT